MEGKHKSTALKEWEEQAAVKRDQDIRQSHVKTIFAGENPEGDIL